MKKPSIPVIESVLAVVVIGLVGFTAWFVWDSNRAADKVLEDTSKNVVTKTANAKDVSVTESKLPAGWTVLTQQANAVIVASEDGKCTSSVAYSKDALESNAPNTDHFGDTIKGIESKGYTVRKMDTHQLRLQTAAGPKDVPVQTVRVSMNGTATTYQQYAFVSTKDYFATAQISCEDRNKFTEAEAALGAVTINHELL